jgi:hypothetical protein
MAKVPRRRAARGGEQFLGLEAQSIYGTFGTLTLIFCTLRHAYAVCLFDRYLTVIPSHLPDFGTVRQPSAWDPPFISLITSNRNQLKACMVAGKDSTVSVNVYDHYRPCTSDLLDLMMSVQYLRKVTADYYLHGLFRLCIKHQADAHDAQTDDETLRKAFEDQAAVVEGMSGIIAFLPFRTAALMLTPQQDSPDNNYISRISVDLLNWQSQVAMRYCGANGEVQEDRLPAKAFLIGVSGALYDQAVAFGRTVCVPRSQNTSDQLITIIQLNVAYAFRKAFGFFVVSVYTRNRVTPEQAKGFTQIIEQNFLKTSSSFLDKPGGHVIIVDGSKAARQMTERQGMKPVSATIAYRRLGSETQPRVEATRFIERGGGLPRLQEPLFLVKQQEDMHVKEMEALYAKLSLYV